MPLPLCIVKNGVKVPEEKSFHMSHDDLRRQGRAVVEKEEKLSTADYLEQRAKRGSREKLLSVLAKAPDVEPEEHDKL